MRCLALETSSFSGSIAVVESGKTLAELYLSTTSRTAQSLAPGIKQCLDKAGWKASHLDLVAVSQGPGSFTGLRLGVVSAKTLAYVAKADLIGVSTLKVVAAQAPANSKPIVAVIDAQREQVFTATFTRSHQGVLTCIAAPVLMEIGPWCRRLEPSVAVSGPGLGKLVEQVPPQVQIVDSQHWNPRASTVASLAVHDYEQGEQDDIWQLVPEYLRKSAAEEKADKT